MKIRHITSAQNELVKHLVKLRQNQDYRVDHQSLMIEGIKPVEEVITLFQNRPKTLVVWNESLLHPGLDAEDVVLVPENVMKKISGMHNPEGLVAEIPMPKPASLKDMRYIIALDGVADPGNVGALLRTALGLGWEGAFILNESCDPFNEKALRAARGATFRLPLAWGTWDELRILIEENGLHPIVADLKGSKLQEMSFSKERLLLVLGNEAHGVSKEAKEFCQAVTIAMHGQMESLNVAIAGGIIMYALKI